MSRIFKMGLFSRSKTSKVVQGKIGYFKLTDWWLSEFSEIERDHRTMKNIIKLEHYYSPEELEAHIAEFVNYYNNQRYHESLNNVTPADVYFGRDLEILARRERIKQRTLLKRKLDFEVQKTTLI